MKCLELANPRVLGNIILHRATLIFLHLRLSLQRILRLTHEYQPDRFIKRPALTSQRGRSCRDRYAAFTAHLPDGEALSVMDIGCNRGYFVFRMAERGGLCIGVDSDRSEIMFASALATVHRIPNAVFTTMVIDMQALEGLPSVDVTICLSIFHHWVRNFGVETAKDIMQAIADRTSHYMFFETGVCEEEEAAWASELFFVSIDSERWTRRF